MLVGELILNYLITFLFTKENMNGLSELIKNNSEQGKLFLNGN